jgi:hypothetical protein
MSALDAAEAALDKLTSEDGLIVDNRAAAEAVLAAAAYDSKLERADRYHEALEEIVKDLGRPGDPAWVCAMDALGLDVEAAIKAWQD